MLFPNNASASWLSLSVRATLIIALLFTGFHAPFASAQEMGPRIINGEEARSAANLSLASANKDEGEGESDIEPEPDPLPAPILRSPEDGAVLTEPTATIEWYLVTGAEEYLVEFAHDAGFNMLLNRIKVAKTLYTLSDLPQDGTAIYWRVQALNDTPSTWSETRRFISAMPDPVPPPPAPVLNRPANGESISGDETRLQWFIVEGADKYTVELAYDEAFTMIDQSHAADNTYFDVFNLPQDDSRLYWRVRAENETLGLWSESRYFISALDADEEGEDEPEEGEGEDEGLLPPPVLDKPADGAEIDAAAVTLRWYLAEGAEAYQVQIARDEAFSKLERDAVINVNYYEVSDLPRDGSLLYWHVRAHQLYTGIWSETRAFTSVSTAGSGSRIRAWLESQPWGTYLRLGGIVLLALGILWVAEDAPTPCMIATAAYGTPMAGQITVLRMVRDRVLLNTYAGTALVDVYYRNGGRAAAYIANHPTAAALVRLALTPILAASTVLLFFPRLVFGAAMTGGALAMAVVALWLLRRRRNMPAC